MKAFWILLITVFAFSIRWVGSDQPEVLLQKETKIGLASLAILQSPLQEVPTLFTQSFGFVNTSSISPLTILFTTPMVSMFGYTPHAIRLPAIIWGTVSILCFWYLVRSVTRSTNTALLATLLLAISPWHIQLSRVDLGLMMGFTFYCIGLRLCMNKQIRWSTTILFTTMFSLASIADYSYAIPALCAYAIILITYVKNNVLSINDALLSLSLFILIIFPVRSHVVQQFTYVDRANGALRLSLLDKATKRVEQNNESIRARILFHPFITSTKYYIDNALQYIEPSTLFYNWQSTPTSMTRKVGLFYPIDLLAMLFGAGLLLTKTSILHRISIFTLLLLVIWGVYQHNSPDPARLFVLLLPATALLTVGFQQIVSLLHHNRLSKLLFLSIFLFMVTHTLLRITIYAQLPSPDYFTEYRQAIDYVNDYQLTNNPLVIFDQSYGHDLPLYWISLSNNLSQLVTYIHSNNAIHFGSTSFIYHPPESFEPGTTYILPLQLIPSGIIPVAIFGNTSFKLAVVTIPTELR